MSNTMTFDHLLSTAKDLGVQAGQGKDTQVKFLLKVIEGGYHNTIDLNRNKHGTELDDATKLAEAYMTAQNGAVIFDAKAGNVAKLVSCMRTGIKLGAWPKGGNGEPLATVNNLVTTRQNLRKDPAQRKKLKDAFNTVMDYARVQLKRDTLLDDAELKDLCFKKDPDLATAEEIVENIHKQLQKLTEGKAAKGTAQDNTKFVRDAKFALSQRLAEIAKARGAAQGPAVTATVKP